MENFKRMNKNSKLEIMNCTEHGAEDVDAMLARCENDRMMLLQLAYLGGVMIAEYISKLEDDASLTSPASSVQYDIDFQNYLDTIINKDPFSAKYSGKPIRAVFEAGDEKWLDKALNEMRNEFIRDRLQYIVDRGGYGKIIRK